LPFATYRLLLRSYLKPYWAHVLLLFFLFATGTCLLTIGPIILQSFLSQATKPAATTALIFLALLFLGVAIIRPFIALFEVFVAENLSLQVTNKLRLDLTLHCLQQDPEFHSEHPPGELIERVDDDVSDLSNFFSRFLVSIVGNIFLIAGIQLILFHIDWRVGGVISVFTVSSLILINRLHTASAPYWRKVLQLRGDLYGFFEEHLVGIEDIRSNRAENYIIRRLSEQTRFLVQKQILALQMIFTTRGTMVFLFSVSSAVSLAVSIYLFSLKSMDIITVYTVYYFTILLNRPIEQILEQWRDLQQSTGCTTRIVELLQQRSSIQDGEQELQTSGPLQVECREISFRYTKDTSALQHITFSLHPGEVLGLLGRTGSGKSTLTKLLTRLYDPDEGTIYVNGIALQKLRLQSLRTSIAVVNQEVQILHATVRENLTLFNESIPDAQIIQTLQDLGLENWYRELPDGLDTKLAPDAYGLSAGEAQLLAFARVFLCDPRLVILDEASSRLDPITEHHLERAIDRLLAGRTAIIVAHRLTTLQRADTILILENGHCIEQGPRQQLAQDPYSRFAQLLQKSHEEVFI
jgi:ATP-binding cassette subfamily B protein